MYDTIASHRLTNELTSGRFSTTGSITCSDVMRKLWPFHCWCFCPCPLRSELLTYAYLSLKRRIKVRLRLRASQKGDTVSMEKETAQVGVDSGYWLLFTGRVPNELLTTFWSCAMKHRQREQTQSVMLDLMKIKSFRYIPLAELSYVNLWRN